MNKGRYMRLSRWREYYFEDESRPDARTARKAFDNGEIPGRLICGQRYIDIIRFENDASNQRQSAANPALIEQVLSNG